MSYQPPTAEIAFTLNRIAGLSDAVNSGAMGDLSDDTVAAILEEAGKFAADVLAPINKTGDKNGARIADGAVTTAPGWQEAYRQFAEAGWISVSAPERWGGQGLPISIQMALQEMWNSGAAAFATGPMLTVGAIEAIEAHASDALKDTYLPKLISGEWSGTMNLTEPQAGTDLGALRTRAERAADGTYRIFGQKIFITYGEHDLAKNIIHLVLARLPDAPPGTAGISLFLVPKFLVNEDGSLGRRNDLICAGIEHKLGLHASPTCTMVYGDRGEGAVGYVVGAENRGLAAMFTMMNLARLNVGIQGVGVGARAYGDALAYAHQRRQGRATGAPKGEMSPIVRHPSVQRDLLAMKAEVAAARAICYACAFAIDMSRRGPEATRAAWHDRASLLTPLAKSYSTDIGIDVASRGVQVHGGMGYIEETGAAQYLRDARIFAIYEGTNGIQAIDLVTRKLRLADGAAVEALITEFDDIAAKASASNRADFGTTGRRLATAIGDLRQATAYLGKCLAEGRVDEALAGATHYQKLLSLVAGGALLAKGGLAAAGESEHTGWIALARYFAETFLDECAALAAIVTEGAEALRQAAALLDEPAFAS
jgi:alkylation response protein AidB-like acyl-CoA dehydrogenase